LPTTESSKPKKKSRPGKNKRKKIAAEAAPAATEITVPKPTSAKPEIDPYEKLQDIEGRRKEILRKSQKLNKKNAKNLIGNELKVVKMQYLGINDMLEKLMVECDKVPLDKDDEKNRGFRKQIVTDVHRILEATDKKLSFM
jgi:hypothetical protein